MALCASAADKPAFVVGWSVYAGWNPWYYMGKSGILRKWGDKYNVSIRVQRFDYAASLDAFVAKNIDACAMTNMEALDMPAAAGVETTSIITGDYSNGNDALLARNNLTLQQLPGHKVLMVQKTVSQYLFERAMTLNGLEAQIKRVKLVNTSDTDIATAFIADTSQDAVTTWKPMVSQIAKAKGVKSLFNSSQIPGEILDLMVLRSEILNRPDGSGQRFAKALTGAWYETIQQMSAAGSADKTLREIAAASEDSLESYKEQLATTNLFYTPAAAVTFTSAPDFKTKMNLVRQFCFTHGLLGGVASADDVAISYPDSTPCRASPTASNYTSTQHTCASPGRERSDMFRVDSQPGRLTSWSLSWFLFAAAIALYFYASHARHVDNPGDRVIPNFSQLSEGISTAFLNPPDEAEAAPAGATLLTRFLGSMLWTDTLASAKRFLWSMLLLIPAVLLGLHMGMFPVVGQFFLRFILFFDKIVALSVLPILFIAFGIDELSKIALIVIGVTPTIILDTVNLTRSVPNEQIVKGFTLGAGDFAVTYSVVLRQIMPRVLNSIRLNLKAVMLFLFAGEMIASQDRLAFRIALLRRHMGMNVIIPYVLWVALLLFLTDFVMRAANRRLHPWFEEA